MRIFVKEKIKTVVDDDDYRIPAYSANGWEEAAGEEKPKDDADKRIDKAINEVNACEGNGKGKSRKTAPNKKINEAIGASKTAETEREAVDDGLFKEVAR